MVVQQDEFQPQTIPFGRGVIHASSPDFVNGFQAGQADYVQATTHRAKPYEDGYITELFLENLEDISLSSLFSIGYAVGWLNALATKGSEL